MPDRRPAPPTRVRRTWRHREGALPGLSWDWTCPAELHGGRPGEVVGERFEVGDWPDAFSACLAAATRHAALYHADGRRLGLALDLEAREVGEDDGPVDPPDPDAVHHLEVCS